MKTLFFRTLLFSVLLFAAAGCSLRNRSQMDAEVAIAPTLQETEPNPQAFALSESGGNLENSYRINPGDELHVSFPGYPELTFDCPVRPDGFITSPAFGDFAAMGSYPRQLADSLFEAYSSIYRIQRATVGVTAFGPSYFYVFGEVAKPARYELDKAEDLVSALSRAGGFTRSASTGNLVVVRVAPSGEYRFSVHSLSDLDQGETLPVWVQQNDIIIVPSTTISDVARFVDDYLMTFIAPLDSFLRGRYYWYLAKDINR